MPQTSGGTIPLRKFGRSDAKISALGFGGHHLGEAPDEKTAVEIIHQAVDGGITFYDNCWEYRRGKTEIWMGAGLKGRRDKVFLMTKTCPHGRDASLALQMLEESLRRLQTDHLDLWQVHGMAFDNDAELFIRKNGAAEALEKAKKDGKVRFVGFTGHQNPKVHLAMLNTGFPFDAVQMPLNAFDANFRSFEQQVLPELNKRGFAVGKRVAYWLRAVLKEMSLEAVVKTSGKTGLHVFVPIERTVTFDEARHICETVGRHVMREHPRDITMEWAIEKRTGKIFIDYNMNVRGKTLNVAYSPRGVPGAPVSMPLSWEELEAAEPTDFTIANVPTRLEKSGDRWHDVLETKQSLTKAFGIDRES